MDKNKLQNMDHQELTNAAQRPDDQEYDQDAANDTTSQPKSGLTVTDAEEETDL